MNKDISEIAKLIFSCYPKLRKTFRNLVAIKNIPISVTQLTCMHILYPNNELSMSELAESLCMSNQQLTKVVDALADLQLAERVSDPKNRRKIYAKLTEKGVELLDSLKEEIDRKLQYILRKHTPEEIDKLYDSIAYVASYVGYLPK